MIIVKPQHQKDITIRLREWLDGKWPTDRCLDDDLLDALNEIKKLRGPANYPDATYDSKMKPIKTRALKGKP